MPKQIEQSTDSANTSKTPAGTQPSPPETTLPFQTDTATVQQRQQQQPVVPVEKTTIEWHKLVGAARLMWSKISEAELLTSKGDEQKLTDVVSSRYVLSYNTANAQVKKFLANQVIAECFKPMG